MINVNSVIGTLERLSEIERHALLIKIDAAKDQLSKVCTLDYCDRISEEIAKLRSEIIEELK